MEDRILMGVIIFTYLVIVTKLILAREYAQFNAAKSLSQVLSYKIKWRAIVEDWT